MVWVEEAPGTENTANIVSSHSLNEKVVQRHLALYRQVMFGESALARTEREAMAACVSAVNDCHY